MYDTNGLSQTARFKLDHMLYSGIIREIESLIFSVNAVGVSSKTQDELTAIGELASWYSKTVRVSSDYLFGEFQKLQQAIRFKSSW